MPIAAFQAWLIALAGFLGLFVGSFLNLCIFRIPRNCMNVFRGPSGCPGCCRTWSWAERVPVAGWFASLGRCPACHHSYSLRDPAVELLTASLMALSAWRAISALPFELPSVQRGILFVMYSWLCCVMIISTFINLEFGILPDEMTLTGILIGLACSTLFPFPTGVRLLPSSAPWIGGVVTSLAGVAAGGLAPAVVGVLAKLQSRREVIGMGVIKYSAMLGAILGPVDAALCFVLSAALATLFGLIRLPLRGRLGYVQFGPFQSVAALALLFWSPQMHAFFRALQGHPYHPAR
jgi:leader peptidase (prepilin peptidase)/N-methyltransferase